MGNWKFENAGQGFYFYLMEKPRSDIQFIYKVIDTSTSIVDTSTSIFLVSKVMYFDWLTLKGMS